MKDLASTIIYNDLEEVWIEQSKDWPIDFRSYLLGAHRLGRNISLGVLSFFLLLLIGVIYNFIMALKDPQY